MVVKPLQHSSCRGWAQYKEGLSAQAKMLSHRHDVLTLSTNGTCQQQPQPVAPALVSALGILHAHKQSLKHPTAFNVIRRELQCPHWSSTTQYHCLLNLEQLTKYTCCKLAHRNSSYSRTCTTRNRYDMCAQPLPVQCAAMWPQGRCQGPSLHPCWVGGRSSHDVSRRYFENPVPDCHTVRAQSPTLSATSPSSLEE